MLKKPKPKTPRNDFERGIHKDLKRKKSKFKYESERFAYVLACSYTPDWVIDTPTGKIYVESKGYFRPTHKRTMVAVKKQHPELDIRILFYVPCSPKQMKINERWAIRNGFRYAFGKTIPKEWLDGL